MKAYRIGSPSCFAVLTSQRSNRIAFMTAPDDVRGAMLAAVPNLRAFAVSLCGDVDRANDLVQETLLRAWSHLESFEPGTNMSAWLFTILRNHFRTEYRKRRREVEDVDGGYAERLTAPEAQTGHIEFGELREALILIGASGFSYEEAAHICDCAVGTIKSRVNRARAKLAEILTVETVDEQGEQSDSDLTSRVA